MKRLRVPPTRIDSLPVEPWSGSAERQVIAEDPETGSRTFLLRWPAGKRTRDEERLLEYHTMHEEIFILDGSVDFGGWYAIEALGYLNHPPYWVHPALQRTANGVEMLIKIDGPVDFGFMDIPPSWDRREFIAPEAPSISPNPGVTRLQPDELPWEPVSYSSGAAAGFEGKTLYYNVETGWATWLMRVPPGWRGHGTHAVERGGDELLVLEGDLTVLRDEPVQLTARSYYCEPDEFIQGGDAERSEAGCLAIRWTRGEHLLLPPIRYGAM